ncbi:MAG: hypothetical protein HOP31_06695 [Ignavibacteria bacterium]|nr:hypothetical protein [Ignavibacteria bacterium]
MKLPFTTEKFLQVFTNYNQTIWPLQILFILLAVICVVLIFRNSAYTNVIVPAILAFFWIWMGLVYHILFFSKINPAAYLFGGFFILESILIIYYSTIRKKIELVYNKDIFSYTGIALIIFAIAIYPLIGSFIGHIYPASPTFGLPCPTTIFTFGILLFNKGKLPVGLIIIPVIWSLIGFTAALKLGIYEDTGLLITGIVIVILAYYKRKNFQTMNLS